MPVACCLFSFDHLIRSLEHAHWDGQADLFRSFQVDDKFKLRCLLHRQVGGFRSLENFVDIVSGPSEQISKVRPVRHEAALIDELSLKVNGRQAIFRGKLNNPFSFGEKRTRRCRQHRIDLLLRRDLKRALKTFWIETGLDFFQSYFQRRSGNSDLVQLKILS